MAISLLRRGAALLMAAGLVASSAAVAGAAGHTEILYSWAEFTEGVAVDNDGNVFVSHSPAGELWKFAPGAAAPEVFGVVGGIDPTVGDVGLLGLMPDRDGNIYGTVQSANPAANGVWVFDGDTGAAALVPGSGAMVFPNSVSFDSRGAMYVTGTALGEVWRTGKSGELEPWIQDDLLVGTGAFGIGLVGANGIAVVDRTVYVANTEQGLIVTIPINRDGSPGTPEVLAGGDALFGVDGIAAAADGSIYAAVIGQFSIARVHQDGTVETVAAAANGDGGILDVSSVAFGTTPDDRTTLYGVNFGFLSQADFGTDPRPGLVAVETGVPGQPLP